MLSVKCLGSAKEGQLVFDGICVAGKMACFQPWGLLGSFVSNTLEQKKPGGCAYRLNGVWPTCT